MNVTLDDVMYSYYISPDLKRLSTHSLIVSSMILFDVEIRKEIEAGRNLRVRREEQNTASALLRIMSRCKTWERN